MTLFSAYEDFVVRTLGSLPGPLARLGYLARLRGDGGDYAGQPSTGFFVLNGGHGSILTSIDPAADKQSVFVSWRTSKGSRCDVQSNHGVSRRGAGRRDRSMIQAMIHAMIQERLM